tara:strand:- start:7721 stop:8560 length:840 start_codon:yes stop_codon:yes gene_type:complete
MFRGININNLNFLQKTIFILKGKVLSYLVEKLNGRNFCNAINFFYSENTKIFFEQSFYKKELEKTGVISYPNKRILRMVNNYELQLKRLIDSYCLESIKINDGDTILDCGANVGELNIALKDMQIFVNYIGFEPDPDTFKCLKLNNPEEQNLFHMNALSNKDGSKEFYIDNYGGNSSLVKFGDSDSIKVSTITLDSLNLKKKIKLFKIDAEGFEPEVLKGSINTLKLINFVSVDYGHERGENQESTIVDVNNLLSEYNFKLIKFSEHRLIGLYENQEYR